ncbi:hypothetical protein [Tropicimonas sp. IMCC6043]|uniref:hypothetical protein n=1 Tax=Tropicimonas sp. IMCC6043 TaxID=2510645 RepID=UPI00101CF2DC|nr:hypothetical protein [Tropicimonas sp. IMCC6043]RYH09759.1 hypothetical protein EU800_10985 [Tropicimonas sp. IMCC6043]
MPDTLSLTPLTATLLFLVLVFSGRAFRQTWKAQAPGWRLRAWLYGTPALLGFLALALLPLQV